MMIKKRFALAVILSTVFILPFLLISDTRAQSSASGGGNLTLSCSANPDKLTQDNAKVSFDVTGSGGTQPIKCSWPDIPPASGIKFDSKKDCSASVTFEKIGEYQFAVSVSDSSSPNKSGQAICKIGKTSGAGDGGDPSKGCKQYGPDWFLHIDKNGKEVCRNIKTKETRPLPGGSKDNPSPGGEPTGGSTYTFKIDPIGPKDFTELLNTIVKWIFNISIPIAVIMIIWGGIQMLIAGDKPDKFKKGSTTLKYAIIGLAVIFIGKGFISLIKSILTIGS